MDFRTRFTDRIQDHARFRLFEADNDDLGVIRDYPMDEFDKQLISDQPWQEPLFRPLHSIRSTQLPSQPHDHHRLTDGPRNTQQQILASSSPTFTASSPTTSFLHNRNQVRSRPRKSANHATQHTARTPKTYPAQERWPENITVGVVTASSDPPHTTPVIQGITLVPTDRLPDHMRSVFAFELFNAVQSKCFAAAFESDDNIIVSAPTGSGKTVVMELALCRLILANKKQDFKAIYQAPTKALCSERCQDWTRKFNTLGLSCAELTGDTDGQHLKNVQSAQIIVTTPEKWDSITRKWRDNAKLMQLIKLFLVDEVHILNESRGATLEAIVSRMKTAGCGVRIIALSATVPNSDDIATWLGRSSSLQHLPAYREVFDESFRPVKLQKYVVGYDGNQNDFALDNKFTREIPNIVTRYGKRKPVMIFCVSKNSALQTANKLADLWTSTAAHLRMWRGPQRPVNVASSELQRLIPAGVAIHHGGLDATDRRIVEQSYLKGEISIICSTSTLAVGINLPCYLVILKGTSCWGDNGIQEYTSLEVMQMLGRAGRPQYETSACAVIMTHASKARRYEKLTSSHEVLESSLHKNLIEHLNAEIGIGTVFDAQSAKKWLTSSFLSVRLRQNPAYYHLEGQIATDDADQLLEQICERDLKLLEDAELIEKCNSSLQCTEFGDAMARYYVQYESMIVFLKMQQKPKVSEILSIMAQAHEFRDFRVRGAEKSMFKEINKANDIRYPIKVDIALPIHKVSLIIQAQLGGIVHEKSNVNQLRQDTFAIMSHCNRLIRCIIDIQIHRKDSIAVNNALELCRSMAAGVWDNTAMQLKQIESIGDVTARKLAAAGIKDIDTLISTESHRLEVVLGKTQPFGSTLLAKAAKFPILHISAKEVSRTRKGRSGKVELQLRCEIGYLNQSLPAQFNRKAVYVCFLCETSDGKLLEFRRFDAKRMLNGEKILFTAQIEKQCSFINCHVMCDEIAGTHRYVELKLDIPGSWFPEKPPPEETKIIVSKARNAQSSLRDDFDDLDLKDDDFLAAELALEELDPANNHTDVHKVTQDADDFQQKTHKPKNPISTLGHGQKKDGSSVKDYHTPKRLANGKWTCQHTCIEEGKDCKHSCCKEGVKRPKKRPKLEPEVLHANDTIEKAFTKPVKKVSTRESPKIPDIDDILVQVANCDVLAKPMSYVPASKITLVNNAREPFPKSSLEEDFLHTLPDFESDDFPALDEIVSKSIARQTDRSSRNNTRSQEQTQTGSINTSDLDLDPADCDWYQTIVTTTIPGTQSLNNDSNAILNKITPSEPTLTTRQPKHISGPIRTPNEGLPKTSTKITSGTAIDTFDSVPMSEDFFDGIDDADLAMVNELDIQPAKSTTIRSIKDNVLSHITSQTKSGTGGDFNIFITDPEDETKRRRQRQKHEQEQKEKWSKFPAWLSEAFAAYVDIV